MEEFGAPWCREKEGDYWQIYQAVRGPDGKIVQLKKTYRIKG